MNDRCRLKRNLHYGPSTMYPKGFSHVGGLEEQIAVLREMILFPLLYEDVYEMFSVKPARGVLFHGPPGTGKTLVAGALAGECMREADRHVSFYSHKGADILDKWVGESEKKLQRVFSTAARNRPAIIFFDEMDGLAPTRSTRNEHIHISIVATLLSLMDGLDSKCGVIVIGATNRVDALDPALRRPGRFDRELYFPLPSLPARMEIIRVHVSDWGEKPSSALIRDLGEMTVGCNGADLNALCSSAVVCCIKRLQPTTGKSSRHRRAILKNRLKVLPIDFINACSTLKPRWQRMRSSAPQPLPIHLQPLLKRPLELIVQSLYQLCPHFMEPDYKYSSNSEKRHLRSVVLSGDSGQAQDERLAPAMLHRLEHLPCTVLDVAAMYGSSMSTEEACLQVFQQAKSVLPSVLYIKNLASWWSVVDNATRLVFSQTLHAFDANMPLLILATSTGELPKPLLDLFDPLENIVIKIANPSEFERADFFSPLFYGAAVLTPNAFKFRSEKFSKGNSSTFSAMCTESASQSHRDAAKHNPETCLMKSDLFDTINKNHTFVGADSLNLSSQKIVSESDYNGLFSLGRIDKSELGNIALLEEPPSKKTKSDSAVIKLNIQVNSGAMYPNKSKAKEKCNKAYDELGNVNNCKTSCKKEDKDGNSEPPIAKKLGHLDRTITVNKEDLKMCFKRTVQVTSNGFSVMGLEKLYRLLETVMANYADHWNRQGLISDVNKVLTEFETST